MSNNGNAGEDSFIQKVAKKIGDSIASSFQTFIQAVIQPMIAAAGISLDSLPLVAIIFLIVVVVGSSSLFFFYTFPDIVFIFIQDTYPIIKVTINLVITMWNSLALTAYGPIATLWNQIMQSIFLQIYNFLLLACDGNYPPTLTCTGGTCTSNCTLLQGFIEQFFNWILFLNDLFITTILPILISTANGLIAEMCNSDTYMQGTSGVTCGANFTTGSTPMFSFAGKEFSHTPQTWYASYKWSQFVDIISTSPEEYYSNHEFGPPVLWKKMSFTDTPIQKNVRIMITIVMGVVEFLVDYVLSTFILLYAFYIDLQLLLIELALATFSVNINFLLTIVEAFITLAGINIPTGGNSLSDTILGLFTRTTPFISFTALSPGPAFLKSVLVQIINFLQTVIGFVVNVAIVTLHIFIQLADTIRCYFNPISNFIPCTLNNFCTVFVGPNSLVYIVSNGLGFGWVFGGLFTYCTQTIPGVLHISCSCILCGIEQDVTKPWFNILTVFGITAVPNDITTGCMSCFPGAGGDTFYVKLMGLTQSTTLITGYSGAIDVNGRPSMCREFVGQDTCSLYQLCDVLFTGSFVYAPLPNECNHVPLPGTAAWGNYECTITNIINVAVQMTNAMPGGNSLCGSNFYGPFTVTLAQC